MDVQLMASYSLEAPLGRGGMGLVYRARHLVLDKEVAIKFMTPALSEDPVFGARFLQEARMMARIDHPNIVRVLDAGEHDNRRFLVMELLEGETLSERLQRQPPLEPREAIRITSATLAALEEIHTQVVVHRDIKPANVFLCRSGAVKIMDFGIALATTEPRLTEFGKMIGTPEYMSPEQADGSAVTAWSDLYSVGVVLYEMLAGKPPFTADSPLVVLNLHVNRPLPPLPDSIPAPLRQVVDRALAKQPASRYASAREMLEALKAAEKSIYEPVVKVPEVVVPRPAENTEDQGSPRKYLPEILVSIVMGLVVGVLEAWKAFNPSHASWNSTFEAGTVELYEAAFSTFLETTLISGILVLFVGFLTVLFRGALERRRKRSTPAM